MNGWMDESGKGWGYLRRMRERLRIHSASLMGYAADKWTGGFEEKEEKESGGWC